MDRERPDEVRGRAWAWDREAAAAWGAGGQGLGVIVCVGPAGTGNPMSGGAPVSTRNARSAGVC